MCHLKVSVDDGRLALVKARNSITGVTEDLQHLSLGEASLQPLIHQIDHLPSCKITSSCTLVYADIVQTYYVITVRFVTSQPYCNTKKVCPSLVQHLPLQ